MASRSTLSDRCPRCNEHATVRRVSPGLLPLLPLEWALQCDVCAHEWTETIELVKPLRGVTARPKRAA